MVDSPGARRWSSGWRLRVETRNAAATARPWHRVIAIAVGLGVGLLYLLLATGLGTSVFSVIWTSTLGGSLGISQTLALSTPLILSGCAFAFGQRCGLWNLGVEGQLFIGAWAATAVAFEIPHAFAPLLILLMIAAGLLGGLAWILVAAAMRVFLGVSELFGTLMLNFVAALWVAYWATGPWRTSSAGTVGLLSRPLPADTALPQFQFGSISLGLGFFIAIGVAAALWLALRYTRYGFVTALSGTSDRTARYAGINVRRLNGSVLLASGALGGLVGVIYELDQVHTFSTALSNNTGYIGMVVAVLAGASLLGCIPTGLLMGFVSGAGSGLQVAGLSDDTLLLLTGILLLFGSAPFVLARYGLSWSRADAAPRVAVEPLDEQPVTQILEKESAP